jgi:hypothetical protein
MLFRAISLAKKEGSKKVPINFQVYPELKDSFESLCKKNNVSVTSMLTALMETAIEEARGIYFNLDVNALMQINQRILEVERELDSKYHWEDDEYVLNDEYLTDQKERAYIMSLENEKARLLDVIKINKQGGFKENNIEELKDTIISMNELIEKNMTEFDVGFDPILIKLAAEHRLKEIAGDFL